MHSIINNADKIVHFLDYTTLSLLGGSAVIIGQSMVARLRNGWVANHAPQPTYSKPEPEPEPESEPTPDPESAPSTDEAAPVLPDLWETPNQISCKLLQKEVTMTRHATNRRLLKEAALTDQDYYRMRKQKLIEIAKSKGVSGANKKKKKTWLVAKLSEAS
jgi:hypothetical protein